MYSNVLICGQKPDCLVAAGSFGSWSDRCVCFTQVGRSWQAAGRAALCAGCIQTSILHLSAPRLRSDRPPGEKPHLLLLLCSYTQPGNTSVEFKPRQGKQDRWDDL